MTHDRFITDDETDTNGFTRVPAEDFFGVERRGRPKDEYIREYKAAIEAMAERWLDAMEPPRIEAEKLSAAKKDPDSRDALLLRYGVDQCNLHFDFDQLSIMVGCIYSALYTDGSLFPHTIQPDSIPNYQEKKNRIIICTKFLVERVSALGWDKGNDLIALALKVADNFLKHDDCYDQVASSLEWELDG